MNNNVVKTARVLLAGVVLFSACAVQKAKVGKSFQSTRPQLIWQDPGDIASREVYYGPGGPAHVPRGKFKFVKEIPSGASSKFDVEDETGVRWRVKPGIEARPETAATRLLHAVGYFADEDYFLHEIQVDGLTKSMLTRGQRYVMEDGVIVGVRMERHGEERKKVGTWDWMNNPFTGTKELSGLKIMMALFNNSDVKPLNNAIYEVNGEYRYAVGDIGASFGRPGTAASQTKDNLFDYRKSRFIKKTTSQTVEFDLLGPRAPIDVLFPPLYLRTTQRQKIVSNIPRAHARWLGGLLAQLTDQQLNDCFRAAGYTPEEVDGYRLAVKQRIAQLNRL